MQMIWESGGDMLWKYNECGSRFHVGLELMVVAFFFCVTVRALRLRAPSCRLDIVLVKVSRHYRCFDATLHLGAGSGNDGAGAIASLLALFLAPSSSPRRWSSSKSSSSSSSWCPSIALVLAFPFLTLIKQPWCFNLFVSSELALIPKKSLAL